MKLQAGYADWLFRQAMQTGYAVIPYRLAMQAGYSVCYIKTGYADRPCKQSALKSVLQAMLAGYAGMLCRQAMQVTVCSAGSAGRLCIQVGKTLCSGCLCGRLFQ